MKVTMTKIWIIAGVLALIGMAQAQSRDSAIQPVSKQVLIDANPYLAPSSK